MMAPSPVSSFKSFWNKADDSKPQYSDKLNTSSYPAAIDLNRLAAPSDLAFLPA